MTGGCLGDTLWMSAMPMPMRASGRMNRPNPMSQPVPTLTHHGRRDRRCARRRRAERHADGDDDDAAELVLTPLDAAPQLGGGIGAA